MARGRRPEDWDRDLAAARAGESEIATLLAADGRLENFTDHTDAFERLDFSFTFEGSDVQVDLKEKIRPTSMGLASFWPEIPSSDVFVLDETVYRRIVWHGGGGYLVVHDHPSARWVIFGPWELTLGPRKRYVRWGQRGARSFAKGKIMLDLSTGARISTSFRVDDLLDVIRSSREQREGVEAVEIAGQELPEIGS